MSKLPMIDEALETAATNWPDRHAFRYREATLSYSTLWEKAKATSESLRQNGVKPGDRVAIAMTKGLEMPIAIHGIWMAGAAFVPLDTTAPVERSDTIIRDCSISVVIGSERNVAYLEKLAAVCRVTFLGVEVPNAHCVFPSTSPQSFEPLRNAPDDLAYIIFTSGSTGAPKGICHTFASGTAFAHAWAAHYQPRMDDVFFCTVPLHFDFSLADFFVPAMVGAMTELVAEQVLLFPASLAALLETSGGTIWSSVPYTFIQLCERGAAQDRDLTCLRWLIYGGEPMPPSSLPLLRDTFSAFISNSYGPAETNQVSEYTVTADHPTDQPIPIGQCLNHAMFRRADDGELLVASNSMMTGYWNRPDLNEEVFVDVDNVRFYRTGDRVEKGPSENWMFLGRVDRQAKVRGYRVELDEVELAMASHACVSEAAVVISSDGLMIHGFVTPAPGEKIELSRLKDHLSEKLPRYMVPGALEVLEAFSKTSTGKINRRKLKEGLK